MSTPTKEINHWIAKHGLARDALNVALARLDAAEKANTDQWVSIEEKLPEMGETVRGRITIDFDQVQRDINEYWHQLFNGRYSIPMIMQLTHWQPLPEPPDGA